MFISKPFIYDIPLISKIVVYQVCFIVFLIAALLHVFICDCQSRDVFDSY